MGEQKPKILCVDDDPKNLKLLGALLTPLEYEIVFAEGGEIALAKVAAESPDIILLDVMMPNMSGLAVLQRLRQDENTRLIPVVMVTALNGSQDRIEALDAGCDDFISKPFDKHELLARVKSLLRIKFLHDEVENNYKKLKQLERLKDSLTHMIVHDLNNPLVAISGGLQLLEMELDGKINPETKGDLGRAVLACQDLTKMINNILDINKMEEGRIKLQYESFNLCEAAKEVVEQMKVIADAGKKALSFEAVESVPTISADRELIKRVIVNLINNAFKFIPSGGVVDIKVFYNRQENNLYTQVKDNGSGIPKDYVDKVFDKFVQVEDNKSKIRVGHGLGLTFCKLAVEAHGGRIWVESELDKGSLFTFILPCKPPAD